MRALELQRQAARGPPGTDPVCAGGQNRPWNSPVLPGRVTRVEICRDRRALRRVHPEPEVVDPLEQVVLNWWIHGLVAAQEAKIYPAQMLMLNVGLAAHENRRWDGAAREPEEKQRMER